MRRRPKDIKLKDFISDEATKKKLVKMAAPAKERLNVSDGEILNFLRESRTLSEVTRRFGYASTTGAHARLLKLMQTGEVVRLSYGLYRAQGAMTVFGIGDLSEREAQERGLEAYQRKLRELEQAQQSEAPAPAPTVPKIPSNYSRKLRSILEYIQAPHTTREIADHFGYHNTSPVTPILHQFVRDGLVKLTRGTRTSDPYTAVRIGDWPSPSTPSPESAELVVPATAAAQQSQDQTTSSLPTSEEVQRVSPGNHIVVDLRQLAMEFLWSLEPGAELGDWAGTPTGVMQRFVAWHDERLNPEAKS